MKRITQVALTVAVAAGSLVSPVAVLAQDPIEVGGPSTTPTTTTTTTTPTPTPTPTGADTGIAPQGNRLAAQIVVFVLASASGGVVAYTVITKRLSKQSDR